MKKVDISQWNRRTQYDFFKNYEHPFFTISTELDVTKLYTLCKSRNYSFSLSCLFVAIKCANQIREFRYRIDNEQVVEYDNIHIGSTILNKDETFSFCYFNYNESLELFLSEAQAAIERLHEQPKFESQDWRSDLIHCTTLPWISFTGFEHAWSGKEKAIGIPKIVFGKWNESEGIKKVPFSISVHHALMDGIHVGKYIEKMEDLLQTIS